MKTIDPMLSTNCEGHYPDEAKQHPTQILAPPDPIKPRPLNHPQIPKACREPNGGTFSASILLAVEDLV